MKNQYLQTLVSSLPHQPGIYQFYNETGTIIYIGKAKDLQKRVASYFVKNHDNNKTKVLVRKIRDIKYIVVDTEEDALLLENNLIKKYRPNYNVLLKDDKTYPSVCIKNENFPRVFSTRNVESDGSMYFGPYTSGRMVKTILDFINDQYKLRTCNLNLSTDNIKARKFKPCLEYHLGNCKAPCVGLIDHREYYSFIEEIRDILKGNIMVVISKFKDLMLQHSAKYEFEKAQVLKEKVAILDKFRSKSTIVNTSITNVEVYSILSEDKYAVVNFLKVVNGAIVQAHTMEITKKLDETNEDLLQIAITDIRLKYNSHSRELILPFELDMQYASVTITVPQRGDKKHLLDLSKRNVFYYQMEKRKQMEKLNPNRHRDRILETMKNDLNLDVLPSHIECFDNSNIQGSFPVAACVVFKNAKPSKRDYRHFNIKTVVGPDDFSSMKEIIYRRYKRLVDEKRDLPQLIVVDGGKGQLSSAFSILSELGLNDKIAIIGIAKRLEEIFFPGDSVPLYLDKSSETLKVIQHLRNEAHRFGITFHRNQRSKDFTKTELSKIDGIGDKLEQKLLTEFRSVKQIKQKSVDELSSVIGRAKAQIVYDYFHQ